MIHTKRPAPSAHRWAVAAAAGLALLGCDQKQSDTDSKAQPAASSARAGGQECCVGLNECKGKGGCATDDHSCAGKNECKGKGGCNMHCPK